MTAFSTLLKEYRTNAGVSQSELGRLTDIDASYVSRIESGERLPPRREIVLKIATALGIRFDERNTLLMVAEYAPVDLDKTVQTNPTMKLLADVLENSRIPGTEKQLIADQLRLILERYRSDR